MEGQDEKPPLFRSWNHWYVVVIGVLALVIVCLYLFSRHYQ